MAKRYDIAFRKKAVAYLNILNEQDFIFYNSRKVENVRDLCLELDVSSSTLYGWKKEFENRKVALTIEEQEKARDFFDTSDIEEEIKNDSEIDDIEVQNEKQNELFGIRFYSWMAKNHGIKGYSKMTLKQLKVSLGLALIKSSGLVHDNRDWQTLAWGSK